MIIMEEQSGTMFRLTLSQFTVKPLQLQVIPSELHFSLNPHSGACINRVRSLIGSDVNMKHIRLYLTAILHMYHGLSIAVFHRHRARLECVFKPTIRF
ncbi:uncharacterized protein C8R40DRAFT_798296 [Lentinula edodes]|uniref:uncharacterized protein n=1 Tax=Lentinula edodes TaxID=5353 RepID=UPI001E8EE93F|nr:uncharacterized protein C8R40DRAFT_798296 [Lentinula edodes]KAH7868962.1 hypothetical protein C8R40DRAFT_798296 [Lentinula edodes]